MLGFSAFGCRLICSGKSRYPPLTFQRRRHCGDLGFSACACAFILHVAAGGQHQRRKNEDDHDDHQHFDDGDSAFCGECDGFAALNR